MSSKKLTSSKKEKHHISNLLQNPFTIAKSIYKKRINILNAQQSESLVSDNLNNVTLDYEILDNTISDDNISLDTNNATDLDISFQDNNEEERKPKHARLTKDNCKWNPTWEITYPWLYLGKKEDRSALFCKLCETAQFHNNFVTGCEYLKEQSIKRHIETKDHQQLIKKREKLQLSLEVGFTQNLRTNKSPVIRSLINTYWLAKNIVATSKITELTSLIEFHTEYDTTELCSSYILNHPLLESLEIKSRADYGSYSNNHAARDFIDAIGRVIEEVICQEIRESPVWSIMIDESNTITASKNLAIISKHISKNVPVYRYLGMIELTEGTANAIVKELNIFIHAKNLPINRLMNMGSDGASVMLAAQLKQQNPYLIEIHCISHRLALASEDAAASIPYLSNYNDIVRNLYSYFSKSYIRMAHLKMVEKNLEEPELHLLKIITTRWLSLSNVVSNLHRIINSVIQALYEDYEISKTAHALYNMIDQNFLLTTYFLADILNDLRRLTLIFQSDYVSLHEIKIQLNTVIQKITSDFLGANGQEPTWGNHLYQFLEKENILSNHIPSHIQQFARATIKNLQIRFPDHEILNAFYIFDPRNLPGSTSLNEYGDKEITTIAKFYGISKNIK
ncbi:16835_t:CDS:2, partial [Cetraspora pellucida]